MYHTKFNVAPFPARAAVGETQLYPKTWYRISRSTVHGAWTADGFACGLVTTLPLIQLFIAMVL